MLALAGFVLAARERANATESNASTTRVTRGSPWPQQEDLEELFSGATALAWSNLGGLNASLPASMYFEGAPLCTGEGRQVDLRVTNLTEYEPRYENGLPRPNKMYGVGLATVNVQVGKDVVLSFEFVDAATQQPVVVPYIYFTAFDIDSGACMRIDAHTLWAVSVGTAQSTVCACRLSHALPLSSASHTLHAPHAHTHAPTPALREPRESSTRTHT